MTPAEKRQHYRANGREEADEAHALRREADVLWHHERFDSAQVLYDAAKAHDEKCDEWARKASLIRAKL